MTIKYGKFQINRDELFEKSFDECLIKFSHVRKDLIKGAWDIANPKGFKVKKAEKEEK